MAPFAYRHHWTEASTPSSEPSRPLEVLVAGGGVAGLEALLALRDLAGDRVSLTLLADEDDFVYRPMAIGEPFSRGHANRHSIAAVAARLDTRLVSGSLASVDDSARVATTASGEHLKYDALLVAVGAHSEPAFAKGQTWTPEADAEVFGGLLRDIEEGYSKRVAFVAPEGVAWPLPAYELALMTAWEAQTMDMDDVAISIYTPEKSPLAIFGTAASTALQADLDEIGIEVITGAHVVERDGVLYADPAGTSLDGVRVVSLPRAVGPYVAGLAADDRGFIRCDAHGQVEGTATTWAAGDAIAYPTKQGGLAAQQADAAAESIAHYAGASLTPKPFSPVLRGVLLTGRGRAWMRGPDANDDQGEGTAARKALFWPPTKVAGRYIAPFLFALEDADAQDGAQPDGAPVELDLEGIGTCSKSGSSAEAIARG